MGTFSFAEFSWFAAGWEEEDVLVVVGILTTATVSSSVTCLLSLSLSLPLCVR